MEIQILQDLTFLQRGVIAGLIIGFICPLLGAFLLVRRISVISEALSHITLTGIAAGILITQTATFMAINPMYFGFLFSLIGSLLVERLRQIYKGFQELAVPIILSTGVGLSAILISLANSGYTEWFNFLFGSIVTVTTSDLYFIIIVALMVTVIFVVLYKEFVTISFDQEYAKVTGIPIKRLNFIFAILIAIVISLSMKVVGILLVGAMITLPIAASIQLSNSFKKVLILGIVFGELSMITGIFLSYYLNIATGGVVVLSAIMILLIVFMVKRVQVRMSL